MELGVKGKRKCQAVEEGGRAVDQCPHLKHLSDAHLKKICTAFSFSFFKKKPSGRQILPGIRSLRGVQALAGEGHPCAWLNASTKTGLLHSTESALLRSGETKPVLCLKLQCNQCFLSLLYYYFFPRSKLFNNLYDSLKYIATFHNGAFFLQELLSNFCNVKAKWWFSLDHRLMPKDWKCYKMRRSGISKGSSQPDTGLVLFSFLFQFIHIFSFNLMCVRAKPHLCGGGNFHSSQCASYLELHIGISRFMLV